MLYIEFKLENRHLFLMTCMGNKNAMKPLFFFLLLSKICTTSQNPSELETNNQAELMPGLWNVLKCSVTWAGGLLLFFPFQENSAQNALGKNELDKAWQISLQMCISNKENENKTQCGGTGNLLIWEPGKLHIILPSSGAMMHTVY